MRNLLAYIAISQGFYTLPKDRKSIGPTLSSLGW